jgi:hypothetical protein
MLKPGFDSSGTVHVEFVPEGETVNKHCYKEISCRLDNSVHRTLLISHHVISFSSPTYKKNYMGVDFSQPRRLSLPQGKLYFQHL